MARELTKAEVGGLIDKCFEAKQKSYSPYSKFPVGAALFCEDGTIFTGVNVENASNGLTICAERTALTKAVSEGYRDFTAIAVCSNLEDTYITPCGMCRQSLVEFSKKIQVIMTKKDKTYMIMTSGELLPHCFTPSDLRKVNGAV